MFTDLHEQFVFSIEVGVSGITTPKALAILGGNVVVAGQEGEKQKSNHTTDRESFLAPNAWQR